MFGGEGKGNIFKDSAGDDLVIIDDGIHETRSQNSFK